VPSDGAVLLCPGDTSHSKYKETKEPVNLLDAAGGHQLCPPVKLHGHHFERKGAATERLVPLVEAHVQKHMKLVAAQLEQQRQSLELLVGHLDLKSIEQPTGRIQGRDSGKRPLQNQHKTLQQMPTFTLAIDDPPPDTRISPTGGLLLTRDSLTPVGDDYQSRSHRST